MSAFLPLEVQVRLVRPDIDVPHMATDGAACFDLVACEGAVVRPGFRAKVPCGVAFAIPFGYEGQIRPRSGLGLRRGLHVAFGTIDSDYRGEVSALVFNLGADPIAVNVGDRIAQLAIRPVPAVRFVPVDDLGNTDRGTGGWGHTGR